ncbi:GGDEF domain-containing protein [Cyanobium sp. FGCU-52]|nr:GGDEF domain-containing protein [Cyanobium sp. FGCU52]
MPAPSSSSRRPSGRRGRLRLRGGAGRGPHSGGAPTRKANDPIIAAQLGALQAEDFELRFQPILLVRDPGQCAMELLVRFRSPALAALGTGAVVQCAQELGLVHRLDELVLQRLGDVQQAWHALGPLRQRIRYITVNISAGSVETIERQDALIRQVRDQRVDRDLFRFELSETAAMEQLPGVDDMRSVSQRLMEELNVRLLVDDFGSGLSNYRRLCEAWYDAIKLDLQLVRGIAASFRMQTFVGSLIEAVHGFGKTVVAEGVEQQRDLELLLRLGVDALQGYLIAKPLPWPELAPFLRDSPWLKPDCLSAMSSRIQQADARVQAPLLAKPIPTAALAPMPLERYVLNHWASMRDFEEVMLCCLRELQSLNLDVLRLSFAFLPDQEEVDCHQFIWHVTRPGEVQSIRMQRDFLQTAQHLSSVLHHIATRAPIVRLPLGDGETAGFAYLEDLRQQGGTDYLGLRLSSRGVSTPVVSICLRGTQRFSEAQVERIEMLSNLLSLLFHAFECERASRLALLDSLTELPNRRSFDSRIRAEVVAVVTAGKPLALALIDLDRFKQINDTLGHAHGDACLSQVAALLAAHLPRNTGFVARLGGEEFGLILPDHDAGRALAVGEELRQLVEGAGIHHPSAEAGHRLTISVGIAILRPESGSACAVDLLLQLADDCLYAAKRSGRNRVVGRTLDGAAGTSAVDHASRGAG